MLSKPEHCKNCLGWAWGHQGYVPADGSGENGVLVVAEAGGEYEATEGMPLVGKAGYYLWQQLLRVGIEREGFRLHNALSCRPPNNKLAGMSYEDTVITTCSPLLDETIRDMQERCRQNGKTFVIVTLGAIAFRRIMGLPKKHVILGEDYLAYPFWSERYQAWVLAAEHPSYLMRGANHRVPILQFVFKRALEIASGAFRLATPQYLLDPHPATFAQWVHDYLREWSTARPDDTFLSYDIETPYKQGKSEEELAKEDEDDFQILRCSFSYRPNEAISVPWTAEYLPYLEELFRSPGPKLGWNSANYDDVRIMARMPINGDRYDGMLAWHVLNSALPKALGFVAPFYVKDTGLWKHLSDEQPAFYNAKDANMALQCFMGIKRDLERTEQWPVFMEHVIRLNRALSYMSARGVLLDQKMRAEAETTLQEHLDAAQVKMEAAIPKEARRWKIYKKKPKDLEGVEEVVIPMPLPYCGVCGELRPTKAHGRFCPTTEKILLDTSSTAWRKSLDFKVSHKGLQAYQRALMHQAVLSRKERKVTFDEEAILKLIKQHPNDPLYPLILEHREYQKLLSTYIGVTGEHGIVGGMPLGRDGRVHTLFTHNPSTLRLASQNPNLQNLPRPGGANDLQTIVRNLIVAGDGSIFTARDYSGIEAVLVGYFACSPRYIRLAKIDVHTAYMLYCLHELEPTRVTAAELPELSWPDERLIPHLAYYKKKFKDERNSLYKHLVHGGNFAQTPFGAQAKIFLETGIDYPVSKIGKVMAIYKQLFPEIPRWHQSILLQVEKDGFVRNPFGYVHRFFRPFSYEKIGGKWERKHGDDAAKIIAFLPQSTAAGIIKEAIIRLFFERFEEAGQFMRLQVHDEIFSECPEAQQVEVDAVMKEEMERPIKCMPLPASYQMGEYLAIDTEGKSGVRWGSMH